MHQNNNDNNKRCDLPEMACLNGGLSGEEGDERRYKVHHRRLVRHQRLALSGAALRALYFCYMYFSFVFANS